MLSFSEMLLKKKVKVNRDRSWQKIRPWGSTVVKFPVKCRRACSFFLLNIWLFLWLWLKHEAGCDSCRQLYRRSSRLVQQKANGCLTRLVHPHEHWQGNYQEHSCECQARQSITRERVAGLPDEHEKASNLWRIPPHLKTRVIKDFIKY